MCRTIKIDEDRFVKAEMTEPIIVEYKGYKIVSSGNFDYGIGSAYIVDNKGDMKTHCSINKKPTKEILRDILTNWVDTKSKIYEQFDELVEEAKKLENPKKRGK